MQTVILPPDDLSVQRMLEMHVSAVCAKFFVYVDGSGKILVDQSSGKHFFDLSLMKAAKAGLANGTFLSGFDYKNLGSEAVLVELKFQVPAQSVGEVAPTLGCH